MFIKNLFRKKYSDANDFQTPLSRCLNRFDLILLSISGMIGSGIYVLTGVVAKEFTGPSIIFANLLAGLACLSGACCYAEFSARIPRGGSSYIYIYESIGEIFAFLTGFTSILGGLTALGVSARVWSSYFDALFNHRFALFIKQRVAHWPNAPAPFASHPDFLALIIVFVLCVALLSGLKNSKWLTNTITVLNVFALSFIGISGFILGNPKNYQPFQPFGIEKIFHGSSLLIYSYIGFEMATIAIEEAKNPSKSVPQATVVSLILVTLLYSFAGASLTYLIPFTNINKDSAFASAYETSRWPWASYLISIAIVLSAGGNLLSGAYGTIRIIYAMSTDGLLPQILSYVSQGQHVPLVATLIASSVIALFATFLEVKDLIGFASISALFAYTGVSIGLLIERYDHQLTYRILLNNENEEEQEELVEFNDEDERTTSETTTNAFQSDPFLSRTIRSLCHCYLKPIDTFLPPKSSAIILLIISICNTCVSSIFLIYFFDHQRIYHKILLGLCLLIDIALKFLFCLLRAKRQSSNLLFTCPAMPLTPLLNMNIFIYLMLLQDAHDWFAYVVILIFSLMIYFAYSYRHSKSR
uniref:Solute carrier family 7-like protein n=1 Tax=Philodina roseola TaxID=96448 RepID=B6S314_PHIRO|nr:solute carrier family 7-like protein [Philodina roseola]